MKSAFVGAALVIIISTVPAIACIKSNDAMDADRFKRADINEDSRISFEEALNYRREELANAKENEPSAASRFIGRTFFGRAYPDEYSYEINEEQFRNTWEAGDKDRNGFWSKDEFVGQILAKRCGA